MEDWCQSVLNKDCEGTIDIMIHTCVVTSRDKIKTKMKKQRVLLINQCIS